MFYLTDDVIESTIASTSAMIVALVADEYGLPVQEVAEAFNRSRTATLLRDTNTGYYWDSIPELLSLFKAEIR